MSWTATIQEVKGRKTALRKSERIVAKNSETNFYKKLKELPKIQRCLVIRPESDHIGYACHWLTDSLTNCCLVNLLDVTLVCEDAYSKLVEVVTVADVSDEERFVADLEAEVWS